MLHSRRLAAYPLACTVLLTFSAPSLAQPTMCVDPQPGIVAWWRAENDAVDAIGGNNGSLAGGAGFTSGIVGQSFSFDGTGEVVVPHDASLNLSAFTIRSMGSSHRD